MKTKKRNINIRELFRNTLENAEVIPDASVRAKLMQRVSRKEFMRFNPSRFNIFYLVGIIGAGIVAALMLNYTSGYSEQLKTSGTQDEIIKSDSGTYLEIASEYPVRTEPGNSNVSRKESVKSILVSRPDDSSATKPGSAVKPSYSGNLIHNEPDKQFSKYGLFPDGSDDRKKLRSGFNPEAFLIDPYTSVGCAPFKLRFHNKATSYDSCRWSFGDGGYSNEKDPEWIFDVEGEYDVVLHVYSNEGKQLSSSAKVTVHSRPKARFEIAPLKAVIPNDEIRFMNYSTDAVRFKWNFGDGATSEFFEPRHKYERYSNFNVSLVVFSDWGCSDSLTVLNAFSGSEYFIDFPNAFIPNEQGPTGGYYSSKSDESGLVFHPSYSGVSDYQLKIFSKLGILIFESRDINLGWDGYNKGELCEPGVYIWKVRGKFRNGEPFIKMGDVTLLKN